MAEKLFARQHPRVAGGPQLDSTDGQRSREGDRGDHPRAGPRINATFRQNILLTDRFGRARGLLHSCNPIQNSRMKVAGACHSNFVNAGLATGQQSSGGVFFGHLCLSWALAVIAAHENADPGICRGHLVKQACLYARRPPRKRKIAVGAHAGLPRLTGRPHSRENSQRHAQTVRRDAKNRSVPARRPSRVPGALLSQKPHSVSASSAGRHVLPARPTGVRVRRPRSSGRGQRAGSPATGSTTSPSTKPSFGNGPHGWLPRTWAGVADGEADIDAGIGPAECNEMTGQPEAGDGLAGLHDKRFRAPGRQGSDSTQLGRFPRAARNGTAPSARKSGAPA